jgi:hypothetical protein
MLNNHFRLFRNIKDVLLTIVELVFKNTLKWLCECVEKKQTHCMLELIAKYGDFNRRKLKNSSKNLDDFIIFFMKI